MLYLYFSFRVTPVHSQIDDSELIRSRWTNSLVVDLI